MILSILATLLAVWCYVVEFRRDLMMLQQNSYRNERYNRWLHASQDTTSVMGRSARVNVDTFGAFCGNDSYHCCVAGQHRDTLAT